MTNRGPVRTAARSSAVGVVAAPRDHDPFGDRFPTRPIPTQPIPTRHIPTRPTAPSAHRHPPPARRRHGAPTKGPSTILLVIAVVTAAVIGVLGHQSSVAPDDRRGPVPAADARTGPPRDAALGVADGAVPDGVTVFDDLPAVANLDPALRKALRRAATDAADDRVVVHVNSGWRSPKYQDQLLREAVSQYGSEREAARWVATADTSLHVSGDAIDIGPAGATTWLSEHGAEYGLCRIYRNEPWHYELRPDAVIRGCPPLYADPTHDPRMQK